jgi:quercetin dioxygenase-like cupin family protein
MNRSKFLKAAGAGLGMALVPATGLALKKRAESLYPAAADPKLVKDSEGSVHNVIGDVQTHKLVGADTGGQITEWVDNVPPGAGIPPHVHTLEDEIFRVVKGEVEITINGRPTVLMAGDMAFAPKNVPHAWKVVGTETAKMITSAFPAGIETMFYELAELPAGPPDLAKVAEICGRFGITFVS